MNREQRRLHEKKMKVARRLADPQGMIQVAEIAGRTFPIAEAGTSALTESIEKGFQSRGFRIVGVDHDEQSKHIALTLHPTTARARDGLKAAAEGDPQLEGRPDPVAGFMVVTRYDGIENFMECFQMTVAKCHDRITEMGL